MCSVLGEQDFPDYFLGLPFYALFKNQLYFNLTKKSCQADVSYVSEPGHRIQLMFIVHKTNNQDIYSKAKSWLA